MSEIKFGYHEVTYRDGNGWLHTVSASGFDDKEVRDESLLKDLRRHGYRPKRWYQFWRCDETVQKSFIWERVLEEFPFNKPEERR